MSDSIVKDVSKIWDRLFDHKSFLVGEISFFLKEFEEKRGDKEVDNLFRTAENTADTKDTQITRLKEIVNEKLVPANTELSQALEFCNKFPELEENFKQSTAIDEERFKRKIVWESFMDEITTEYNKVNSDFEEKEESLKQTYANLKKNPVMRLINRHLLAIVQYIVSVLAGFAFGFIGVELVVGSLDFGFRLLLGFIFALTIALAELYFLAKKLNEDIHYEYEIDGNCKNVKID